MTTIGRDNLKGFFRKNQIPTEQQFGKLIDSSLNMADDHIFKKQGVPLGVEVGQPASGRQTILNLHRESTTEAVWGLELNPGNNAPAGEQFYSGFSIADKNFKSRFFIKENSSGQIGVGTIDPMAQLHISNSDLPADFQNNIDNNTANLDGAMIASSLSLEAGERYKGNIGSIRLNGYGANEFSLLKAGKSSLELDSTDGELKVNSDSSMHAGKEGVFSLYNKSGTVGTRFTSDDSDSYLVKGNLGLGTASPQEKLHVVGHVQSHRIISHQPHGAGHGQVASFNSNSDSSPTYIDFKHKGVRQMYLMVGNKMNRFQSEQGNNFVFGAGNIGIDNTDPQTSIQIGYAAGAYRTWMDKGLLVGDSSDNLYLGMKHNEANRSDSIIGWGDDSNDKLRFMFLASGSTGEQDVMTMLPTGRVGINNANPVYGLDVSGEINTTVALRVNRTKGGTQVAHLKADDGPPYISMIHGSTPRSFYLMAGNTGGENVVRFVADSADKFRFIGGNTIMQENLEVLRNVTVNGRVGINKPNPAQSLDVNGHITSSRALLIYNTSSSGHVATLKTTSAEAPYISMSHGSTPRSFYLMAGNHAGENVVRFVADSANKFRFYSGDVTIHENFEVLKNLNVNGSVKIDNQSAIVFKRYNVASGRSTLNTTYSTDHYQAAIVGMRALSGDIYENGVTSPIQVYMQKLNSSRIWRIVVDFATHGADERWELDVMFIRNGLATRDGSPWNT